MEPDVAVVGIVVGVVGLVVLGLVALFVGGRVSVSRRKIEIESSPANKE